MKGKLSKTLLIALVAATVGLGLIPPQTSGFTSQLEQAHAATFAETAETAEIAETDSSAIARESEAVRIVIDGKLIQYSQAMGRPYIDQNRRTQVPLNQTMSSFGASVSWDASSHTATVTKDGITVKVPVGKSYIVVNGKTKAIDTISVIHQGRTYLPVSCILSEFHAEVSWEASTRTVIITSDKGGGLADSASNVTVHFIDVGQGDSILIDAGQFEILIDGGPRSAGRSVVDYIKPYVDGSLDAVIATHNHEDHIGGLPDVLKAYPVDRVIDNGKPAASKIYGQYASAIAQSGCSHQNAWKQDLTIAIDNNTSLRLIGMEGAFGGSNNSSLVALLKAGDLTFLFTGDMEQDLEKANLNEFEDIDVLKAGHHGSNTSSCQSFLNQTKPETVIISCATGNTYRHPHLAALQRFQKIGATVYGTEKSGSIQITTDGKTYSVSAQEPLSLEDAGDLK